MFKSFIRRSIYVMGITVLCMFVFTACELVNNKSMLKSEIEENKSINSLGKGFEIDLITGKPVEIDSAAKLKNFVSNTKKIKIEGGVIQAFKPKQKASLSKINTKTKTLSLKQLQGMKTLPKSGLYITDKAQIPNNIEAMMLKELNLKIRSDGTVVNNRDQMIVLILHSICRNVRAFNPRDSFIACAVMFWQFRYGSDSMDFTAGTCGYALKPDMPIYVKEPLKNINRISSYASIANHSYGFATCVQCSKACAKVMWKMKPGENPFGTKGNNYVFWKNGSVTLVIPWWWNF